MGSLLLGISAGMLCTIRLNTGMFLLLPLLDFLFQGVKDIYEKRVGPIDIFNYIYATLYSDIYRKQYVVFLKSDFPRIPFARPR